MSGRITILARTCVGLLLLVAAPWQNARAGTGTSSTDPFTKQMKPLLVSYLAIHASLAADSLDGVNGAARSIATRAPKLDASRAHGEHATHYQQLPEKLGAAARSLSNAATLESARGAFKELSRPMVMWATMAKPSEVDVVYCSMARGSWLQRPGEVRNPYYGSKMLKCGELVSQGHQPGKAREHGVHDHARH